MSRHPPPPPRQPQAPFRAVEPPESQVAPTPSVTSHDREESAVVYRAVDFEHSVHLDAQGHILAGNGKIDELAEVAAYACRLANLVGRQLSFGDVLGMETTLSTGTFFMQREENGEIVCIKPRPHLNLIQLRTQLNL